MEANQFLLLPHQHVFSRMPVLRHSWTTLFQHGSVQKVDESVESHLFHCSQTWRSLKLFCLSNVCGVLQVGSIHPVELVTVLSGSVLFKIGTGIQNSFVFSRYSDDMISLLLYASNTPFKARLIASVAPEVKTISLIQHSAVLLYVVAHHPPLVRLPNHMHEYCLPRFQTSLWSKATLLPEQADQQAS